MFAFQYANAEIKSDSPQYGVALSKNCITMLKNHMKTNCPTYQEILGVFPDNTNPNISGGFKIIDGIFQREKPPVKNNWFWYYHKKEPTLWVDPPAEVRSKINLIIIESSLPEYKIQNSLKMKNYTLVFGKDRFVNSGCTESRITAAYWLILLPDTLNIISHNCDLSLSKYNSTSTHKFEKSNQDITTSAKYQLDKWIKENKEACKKKGCK